MGKGGKGAPFAEGSTQLPPFDSRGLAGRLKNLPRDVAAGG